MTISAVASIDLAWDEYGKVSHTLTSFIPANVYQQQDALALGAALTVASQLGVLSPRYSLELCRKLVDFFHGRSHNPEPIQYPLTSARIDLHKKDDTIIATFEPNFIEAGTMEPEEAVRRLLTALVSSLGSELQPELVCYLRNILLGTSLYYLTAVLPQEMERPSFSLDRTGPELNLSMIGFCHSIFHQWKGGPTLPPERFRSILQDVEAALDSISTRVSPGNPTIHAKAPLPASATPSQAPARCEACGVPANTKYVEFYENVGALVVRYHRSARGRFCKSCINAYFWNYTGKTVVFGWWGVISFIVTPFILLNNILRYITTIGMRAPIVRIGPAPAPQWIFTTIAASLLVSWCILSSVALPTSSSTQTQPPPPQAVQKPQSAAPTRARPTATTPRPPSYRGHECTKWNEIGPSDTESITCIYGLVTSYGPYADRWNTIYFGGNTNALRVIDFNYEYTTPLTPGQCVVVYGRIRDYGAYLIITPDKDLPDSISTTSASACP